MTPLNRVVDALEKRAYHPRTSRAQKTQRATEGFRVMDKKDYTTPELRTWGTVTDLTQTGKTNPGADGKSGSRPSQGQ
jgi:hypothetical protein